MIKAIETVYKGYRFRSRLEARWAVFFDALGIVWEYEKEGLLLEDGTPYLPDFYLPDTNFRWVEIKPQGYDGWEHPGFGRGDKHEGGLPYFIVLVGNPYYAPSSRGQFHPYLDGLEYDGFIAGDHGYAWCQCPDCGLFGLEFEVRAGRLPCKCNQQGDDRRHNGHTNALLYAYDAAQKARFEHGEHGRRQVAYDQRDASEWTPAEWAAFARRRAAEVPQLPPPPKVNKPTGWTTPIRDRHAPNPVNETDWQLVMQELGHRSRTIEGLLLLARPQVLDGNVIRLAFPYDFHRGRIEEPKNKALVEETATIVLGGDWHIECVMAEGASNALE